MSAATALAALAQSLLFVVTGWSVADLVARRRPALRNLALVERLLLALVGGVAFSIALMLAHIVSGGVVFGLPGAVPVAAVATIVFARAPVRLRVQKWRAAAALGAVLIVLYVGPVLFGSGTRIGDPAWHLGWTEQLLAGEPVPTGPAPDGFARNSYPWGFHAVMATLVRSVPGSEPLVALEALHLLVVLAIPLAAACLARTLRADAGWAAAILVSLVGGFGWIAARRPTFATSPAEAPDGADLVVASPNSVYELLPPAFPRELGLVLLAASGFLLVLALRTRDRRSGILAGATAGLVGLVSVPMFIAALGWMLFAAATRAARVAPRLLGGALLAAFVVASFWVGPVVSDYLRFGGFVSITPQLGKEWPLTAALISWGLLLPAAFLGVVVVVRRSTVAGGALLAFAAGTVSFLTIALARSAFDWELRGNATLFHQGRVWPVAHLLAAVLGGVALTSGARLLARRSRPVAVVAGIIFLVLGAVSPVLASLKVRELVGRDEGGYVYAARWQSQGTFVRRAAELLSPDDVVEVEGVEKDDGARELAFLLFQFSGARLAYYDDPAMPGNDLRIRFAELASSWNDRVSASGFDPTHRVVESSEALGQPRLVQGSYKGVSWALVEQ